MTQMSIEEIERLGKELSNGFGLWGTLSQLDDLPGWDTEKRAALIGSWVSAGRSLGFTDVDIAALGDFAIGRKYVDNASFWAEMSLPRLRGKARVDARREMGYAISDNGGIKELKRVLVTHYTDYTLTRLNT